MDRAKGASRDGEGLATVGAITVPGLTGQKCYKVHYSSPGQAEVRGGHSCSENMAQSRKEMPCLLFGQTHPRASWQWSLVDAMQFTGVSPQSLELLRQGPRMDPGGRRK